MKQKMTEFNQYRKDLHDKIISYAMPEFYQRGVKAVKMDEISQGLHVSKRTVYEIFGDKEELLLAGMKMQQDEMKADIERFARAHARNVIDVISYVYRRQMERNQQVGVVFYEEIHKMPRVVKFLKESHGKEHDDSLRFFNAGIEEGLFRSDVNYEVMMEVANLCMDGIMHKQLYKTFSMQQLFDNYFLIMIRGFCTERGLLLLDRALAMTD